MYTIEMDLIIIMEQMKRLDNNSMVKREHENEENWREYRRKRVQEGESKNIRGRKRGRTTMI